MAAPDLLARLAAALEPRPEILEAYLFGSRARGATRPGSDVDVAVYVDTGLAPRSGFGYAAELTTALYCDFLPQIAKLERTLSARIRAGEFGR